MIDLSTLSRDELLLFSEMKEERDRYKAALEEIECGCEYFHDGCFAREVEKPCDSCIARKALKEKS